MKPALLAGLWMLFIGYPSAQPLSLFDAEQLALAHDPAAEIYTQQQQQLAAQGIARSQLADPMVRFGVANLPTDSFELDQDPMTQLTIGVAQQFSRGDTRALTAQHYNQQGQRSQLQAQNRSLELKSTIRQLWLDIRLAQTSAALLLQSQSLFAQNVAHVRDQFELGYKQSQDLIQAELQLSKFDEQIDGFNQQEQAYRASLATWLGEAAYGDLAQNPPNWPSSLRYAESGTRTHYILLADHPKVSALQQAMTASDTQIALAQQAYKPAFKVELGYGLRQAPDTDGSARSDLLSGFVSLNVPLFPNKRQDQSVIAAERGRAMVRAEQDLLLTQMNGELNSAIARHLNLSARVARYQTSLLMQAQRNTQAALQGYQSNTNNFGQVIQAYLDELTLALEFEQLTTQKLKALVQVRYYQGK
jgi:outer membrane protein TolC